MYSMSEGEIKKLKSRIQELAKKLGSLTLLIRGECDAPGGLALNAKSFISAIGASLGSACIFFHFLQ